MRRITDNVFRLESIGVTNVYLFIGTKDLTMIDSGYAGSVDSLLDELKHNGWSWDDVGRVFLTRAEADNAGGLSKLFEKRRVRYYAHPLEIPYLTGEKPLRESASFFTRWRRRSLYPFTPVESVMPIEPGMPAAGFPHWQVLHTPGKTAGSISLFDPVKQVLICGDALVNAGGKLALPDPAECEDVAAARKTAEMLSKMDVNILCTGRGPVVRDGAFRHIEALLQAG